MPNPSELERTAADLCRELQHLSYHQWHKPVSEALRRMAAAEREACAAVADRIATRRLAQAEATGSVMDRANGEQVKAVAHAIRSRAG